MGSRGRKSSGYFGVLEIREMAKEWVGVEGVVSGPFGRTGRVRLTDVRVGKHVLIIFYFEGNR